jgi:multidrug resistance efflux pump
MGRRIYLGFLISFAAVGADYLWGDMIIFRAEGFILRDKTIIAATYLAEVEAVMAREGQTVAKDDVILRLKSTEILEKIAVLSVQNADLARRTAELRTRVAVAAQLTPLASRREMESRAAVNGLDSLSKEGLTTAARREEALRALYDAREARVFYAAESEMLKSDIPAVERAREDAAAAFEDLARHYAGGQVRAPASGAIGAAIPSPGEVYRPGEPLLTIYSGEPYGLVYLPSRYLFSIRKGMRVIVRNDRRAAEGTISEILPVSAALPKEFQNAFKPQGRNQLAKIRFNGQTPFSISEKVTVSLDYVP